MSEIADVLLRNPQAAYVQVQGHTDNFGDPSLPKGVFSELMA